MALVLPSGEELKDYKLGPSDDEAIQMAADLFTMATGVTETPTDPMEQRLVQTAILDMAWYLQVHHEDKEAEFSPFSSEHIGSYSYSKMQQAASQGIKTGVPGFDIAVAYFNAKSGTDTGLFATNTEWVFEQDGVPVLPRSASVVYHDPTYLP